MLNRHLKYYLLMIMLTVVTACVSISDRLQMVSNMQASIQKPQSCEVVTIMNKQPDKAGSLNPENISFLNWNIYKGNGDNWQQDLASFAQQHDVMTIQEALLDDELTGLLEKHNFNWIMNTAFHLNGTAAGVMNVANAQVLHSCGFKVKEPIIRTPKTALVSYYSIKGFDHHLLVANIHGINFSLGLRTYRQQLNMLYDAIKHHDGPMIVAGDFNSWSNARLSEVDELINRLSLSEIEYSVNNKTHIFGNAIDHVFYRQLEIVDNQVWQVSSSDHNPISVKFRLND